MLHLFGWFVLKEDLPMSFRLVWRSQCSPGWPQAFGPPVSASEYSWLLCLFHPKDRCWSTGENVCLHIQGDISLRQLRKCKSICQVTIPIKGWQLEHVLTQTSAHAIPLMKSGKRCVQKLPTQWLNASWCKISMALKYLSGLHTLNCFAHPRMYSVLCLTLFSALRS